MLTEEVGRNRVSSSLQKLFCSLGVKGHVATITTSGQNRPEEKARVMFQNKVWPFKVILFTNCLLILQLWSTIIWCHFWSHEVQISFLALVLVSTSWSKICGPFDARSSSCWAGVLQLSAAAKYESLQQNHQMSYYFNNKMLNMLNNKAQHND